MTEFISKKSAEHNTAANTKGRPHSEKPNNQMRPASTPIPYTMQGHPEDSFFPIARTSGSYLPVQLQTASRADHGAPSSIAGGVEQTTLPAAIQRKISVDAADNSKPPVINTNSDRDFRKSTKHLYSGASIAHVVPFSTIQNFMKAILTSAVDLPQNSGRSLPADRFAIDTQKKGDMRRLVKSIIPSAGYQFDFHEEVNLAPRIQEQQESAMNITEQLFPPAAETTAADTEKNANALLHDLNNSTANLRTGYQNTNNLIQDDLDPIAAPAGGSTLSKVKNLNANFPAAPSFRTVSKISGQEAQIGIDGAGASINELSLAKRMHKLGRLRSIYPGVEVYGIYHAKNKGTFAGSSFYSSEQDINTTPEDFETSHPETVSRTRTAHIKNTNLQKSEYDFIGRIRPQRNGSLFKNIAAAGIGGVIGTGIGMALTVPALGIAALGLLGSTVLGGAHYLHRRPPKTTAKPLNVKMGSTPEVIVEKKHIEDTKFQSAKQEVTRLKRDADPNLAEYTALVHAYKAYKNTHADLPLSPVQADFDQLNAAWKTFQAAKIAYIKKRYP